MVERCLCGVHVTIYHKVAVIARSVKAMPVCGGAVGAQYRVGKWNGRR